MQLKYCQSVKAGCKSVIAGQRDCSEHEVDARGVTRRGTPRQAQKSMRTPSMRVQARTLVKATRNRSSPQPKGCHREERTHLHKSTGSKMSVHAMHDVRDVRLTTAVSSSTPVNLCLIDHSIRGTMLMQRTATTYSASGYRRPLVTSRGSAPLCSPLGLCDPEP